VFRVLLTYMMADPGTIERCLGLILISRNIERIADHATNIAEDVIFMVEGRDVRRHRTGSGSKRSHWGFWHRKKEGRDTREPRAAPRGVRRATEAARRS
jgi:hypothetical protein